MRQGGRGGEGAEPPDSLMRVFPVSGGSSAGTHLWPGFRFFLKAELVPGEEVERSLCAVAALGARRLLRSRGLLGVFGLGLRVSLEPRNLAAYIRFLEVVSHHPSKPTHDRADHVLDLDFLRLSTSSSPSLTTSSCSGSHNNWNIWKETNKRHEDKETRGEKKYERRLKS